MSASKQQQGKASTAITLRQDGTTKSGITKRLRPDNMERNPPGSCHAGSILGDHQALPLTWPKRHAQANVHRAQVCRRPLRPTNARHSPVTRKRPFGITRLISGRVLTDTVYQRLEGLLDQLGRCWGFERLVVGRGGVFRWPRLLTG